MRARLTRSVCAADTEDSLDYVSSTVSWRHFLLRSAGRLASFHRVLKKFSQSVLQGVTRRKSQYFSRCGYTCRRMLNVAGYSRREYRHLIRIWKKSDQFAA